MGKDRAARSGQRGSGRAVLRSVKPNQKMQTGQAGPVGSHKSQTRIEEKKRVEAGRSRVEESKEIMVGTATRW